MIKKEFLIILLISLIGSVSGQILIPKKDYVPEVRKARYSFAVCLIVGQNSSPVSFGIMRESPDSSREMIFLTEDRFIRQISGYESSPANPDTINYLKEYQIDPKVIDEIWKLRYPVYPFGNSKETGWGTEKGLPSERQFTILSGFGVRKVNDYFIGENLFRLLIKLTDPTWVAQYQQSK